MKLLANENVPAASIRVLKDAGFDIFSVGLECPGLSDPEVMELAIQHQRLIITFDRDYGELIFKYNYKPDSGVLYLRFQNFDPGFPGRYLLTLLTESALDFRKALTVVDEYSIRQRRY